MGGKIMAELLKEAAEGWRELISDGKYMVFYMAALMYLWYRRLQLVKKRGEHDSRAEMSWQLAVYAAFILAVAAIPPAGMALRIYQTRFYDYTWVLAYIPMTLIIAFGTVEAYMDCYKSFSDRRPWKAAGLAAVFLAVFLLCGNLQTEATGDDGAYERTSHLLKFLEERQKSGNADGICLWAPADLMTYARMQNGEITLLYGRNMWDEALNAYSYDSYSPEIEASYRWMEDCSDYLLGAALQDIQETEGGTAGETAEETTFRETADQCIKTALSSGVNCMILPEGTEREGTEAGGTEAVFQYVTAVMEKAGCDVIKEQAYGYNIFWIH